MSGEDDFRIRPGRIRSTRAQQARPFIAQALAAAQRAGGRVSRSGQITTSNRSRFGRGQRAREAFAIMRGGVHQRREDILRHRLPTLSRAHVRGRLGLRG